MKPIAQVAAELGQLPTKGHRHRRREYPDPQRQEDADYRTAYGINGKRPFGRGLRAAFYAYLPDAPSGRYVTVDDARRYVAKVQEVIDMQRWPRHEREKLRVILRRWEARAAGRDSRFNAIGVQKGLNEKHRAKSVGDVMQNIRVAIAESAGVPVTRPGQRWMMDKKWPLGRPVENQ